MAARACLPNDVRAGANPVAPPLRRFAGAQSLQSRSRGWRLILAPFLQGAGVAKEVCDRSRPRLAAGASPLVWVCVGGGGIGQTGCGGRHKDRVARWPSTAGSCLAARRCQLCSALNEHRMHSASLAHYQPVSTASAGWHWQHCDPSPRQRRRRGRPARDCAGCSDRKGLLAGWRILLACNLPFCLRPRHTLPLAHALRSPDSHTLTPPHLNLPRRPGHVDMVCEKNADVQHDFMVDPICLVRRGVYWRKGGSGQALDERPQCSLAVWLAAGLGQPLSGC